MAQARGSRASLRMGEEVTFGVTPATPPMLKLPVIDITLALTQGLVASRVLTGTRNPTAPTLDQKSVGGGFTVQPDSRSTTFLLKHLLAAPSTTGAGPYTHVYKVGGSAGTGEMPTSITFEKWFGDLGIGLQYNGCRLSRMTTEVGTSGFLEFGFDVMGADEVDAVAELDAAPVSYPVTGFRLPAVTLSEGGAGLTTATRFSMTLDNGLEETRVIGNGGKVAALPEGTFAVTGGFSVLFESMTMYNKARNNTESAIIVTFPSPVAGHSLQVTLDEINYSVGSPTVGGPGGIVADLDWQGYFDNGASGTAVKATLINDVASAASIPAAYP